MDTDDCELSDEVYDCITILCEEGDEFVEDDDIVEGIKKYKEALNLVPDLKYEYEASTWIYTAIGDAYYLSENNQESLNYFQQALKSPNGIINPFILFRLGQCYYKLNDITNAQEYLLRAYLINGEEVFSEEPMYLDIVKKVMKGQPKTPTVVVKTVNCKNKRIPTPESISKEIEFLIFEKFEEFYINGDKVGQLRVYESAWALLPDDKYAYSESYLIIECTLRSAIRNKDYETMKQWKERLLYADPERTGGERAFLYGKVAYELGDFETALEHIMAGNKESKGRCFNDNDDKYREFLISKMK